MTHKKVCLALFEIFKYRARLQKYLIIYYFIFIPVILIFLISQCTFKAPKAPSWETEVTIPLIAKQYTMKELAEKENNLSIDSTGLLEYGTELTIPRHEIGNRLAMGPFSKETTLNIRKLKILSPGSHSFEYKLNDVYPQAEILHGQTAIIPPFDLSPISKNYPEIPLFHSIFIDSGNVRITIRNNLIISLGVPINVRLINLSDSSLIGETTFSEKITTGQSVSRTITLDNKTLRNQFVVQISGSSSGTEGVARFIDKNSSFTVEVMFSDLIVSEISTQNPQFNYTISDSIELTDSLLIRDALVKKGQIEYLLRNDFEVIVHVVMLFPNIFTEQGIALSETLHIVPKQSIEKTINLDGFHFKAIERDELDHLKVTWTINLASESDKIFTIRSLDAVEASIHLSRTAFSYLTGRLYRIPLKIDPPEKSLKIPSELDSLKLAGALLNLRFRYNISFLMVTDLTLTAINAKGDSVSIRLEKTLPAAPPGEQEKAFLIQLDNAAPLFNIVPTQIKLTGHILIGNRSEISTISEFDFAAGKLQLTVPLEFILPSQLVQSNPRAVTIDEDYREIIKDHIISGYAEVSIQNRLPLGPAVEILISPEIDSVYVSPEIRLGPIIVSKGEIDPTTEGLFIPSIDNQKL